MSQYETNIVTPGTEPTCAIGGFRSFMLKIRLTLYNWRLSVQSCCESNFHVEIQSCFSCWDIVLLVALLEQFTIRIELLLGRCMVTIDGAPTRTVHN